jgi:tetratricopeptide (TPR) repeat protein
MRLIILILTLACVGAWAADDAGEEKARKEFQRAFEEEMPVAQRIKVLEGLGAAQPVTKWTDDARWVLGEVARRAGDTERMIALRRQLLSGADYPRLEEYTMGTDLYATSRLPRMVRLLEATGLKYTGRGIHVVAFNPLPMVAHEEIGQGYASLGKYDLAIRHLQLALDVAPDQELLRGRFLRQIDRLKERKAEEEAREAAAKGEQAPAPDKPSSGEAPKKTEQAPEGKTEQGAGGESHEKEDKGGGGAAGAH